MHPSSRTRCAALLALVLAASGATGAAAADSVDLGGGPQAAPGTPDAAKVNCMDRIHWRSGGSARLVQVIEMENGMTIVKAAGLFGLRYICFADPDGEVVRVRRDGGFGWF